MMKTKIRQVLALVLIAVMLAGFLPATAFTASAASYTYNWGYRGTVATELSDAAIAFYEKYNVSLEKLMTYSGSSNTSSVPSSDLYAELKTLMTTAHTHTTSYNETKSLYQYTDCQGGGGKISSFYSGTEIGPAWGQGSWNREHTWPNSKGLNGSDENDIMMLRPTATSENSSRGNTAYGQSSGYYNPNSESNGKYDLRGDVARICLYVYTRWGNTGMMWGSSGVMESKAVLLQWMEEDPVDTWELGRNDAVQSITGTRNVFVDFPELGFALFDEEVPAGYQSPSGNTQSYTVTAQSGNDAYGAVSVNKNVITAYPYEGYAVSGYEIVSGTATVTQNGNVFTVKATSDCTVKINFVEKTKVTLRFMDQGTLLSENTLYAGESTTLPAYTGTAPEGFQFRGWVTAQVESAEAMPTGILKESAAYTAGTSQTFYALFAAVGEGGELAYTLVTDASQLSVGKNIVIAGATKAVAMKQTGGDNNRYANSVTKNSDGTLSFADSALIDVLTLGEGTVSGTYSLYSAVNGKYLAAGTGSSDQLIMQNSVDNAASFAITVNSDGSATAISQTSGSHNNLRYNSSNNIFACYASGQNAIALYVQSGSGDLYYTTSPIACSHENTVEVSAVDASCTADGYTAGVYCNDCNSYISGHQVIPATGHSYGDWTQTQAPGCTTPGKETHTCGSCGNVEEREVTATGHDYVLSGITYTCQNCGDHYDTYQIHFSVPTGVSKVSSIVYTGDGITLPECGVPTGETEYTLIGWTDSKLTDSTEKPTVYAPGSTYSATSETTLYALYGYSVTEEGGNGDYVQKDITEITDGQKFVITMMLDAETYFALPNNGGSSKPTASSISVETVDGQTKLSEAPDDTLLWNLGGDSSGYIFYPAGQTATWLCCENTNKGVKIGTLTSNAFTVEDGYLSSTTYTRYVGIYNKQDWRCYGSPATNIDGQELCLFVEQGGSVTYYTTEISATEESPVSTWNVALSDDIQVNFDLAETDTLLTLTVAGEAESYTVEGNRVSVRLAATQLTDEISLSVARDGKTVSATYTVRQYCDSILADSDMSAYHAIVKELLRYGSAAQTYFEYHTDALADSGLTLGQAAAIPETVPVMSVSGSIEGVKFYGASLVYRSRIAVRLYFAGDVSGCTFTVGEQTYTPVTKDGLSYIEVSDILPQNLDAVITLTVTKADTESALTVAYSPMNYIVRMNGKGNTALQPLLIALYSYHAAAKALIAE